MCFIIKYDPVIQLNRSPELTSVVDRAANQLYKENQDSKDKNNIQYNGVTNNCSTFAVNLLRKVFNLDANYGVENINTDENKNLNIPKLNINAVTPNFLFADLGGGVKDKPSAGSIL